MLHSNISLQLPHLCHWLVSKDALFFWGEGGGRRGEERRGMGWACGGGKFFVQLTVLFKHLVVTLFLKSVSPFSSSLFHYFVNVRSDYYWQVPYQPNFSCSLQQLFERVAYVTGVVNFSTKIIYIRAMCLS